MRLKGHIPDVKIEEIKSRANIVELVSEYVTLKKAGRNYVGLCPFHKEKTPSFTVTPDKQMFYCFGCGEGGNIFAFLMKINQMAYPEAIRHMARKTGVVIPERTSSRAEKDQDSLREQITRINQVATAHYSNNLFSSGGKEAQAYLKKRGIREDVVREFRLGFAPDGWRHLKDFLEKKDIPLKTAEQAGLLIPGKEASLYDRFRNRLMFPIEDVSGRVIAFGGRSIGAGEPKYLNSPESAVYVKGRNLYGLNRAKEEIRRQGHVILVEGYFDLLQLWNAGITHVVATLGTALTKEQIDLLGRYTSHVAVLFDPDEAGRKALGRSLELFLAGNMHVRVVILPGGNDPDDYVKAFGKESLLDLIAHAPSMVDYYVENAMGDRGTFEQDREALRNSLSLIRHIDNAAERNLFIKRVSEKLGVDQNILKSEIYRTLPLVPDDATTQKRPAENVELLELNLLHLLMTNPEKLPMIVETGILNYFMSPELKALGEKLGTMVTGSGQLDAVAFISGLSSGPVREKLLRKVIEESIHDENILDRLLGDTILQIRRKWYREVHRKLKVKMMKAQEAGDEERCHELLSEKERLLREEKSQAAGMKAVHD
jgi:DNA primase